uniref:Uncharacterized protein n=1 Tax=Tanacetum cinerariifolium TaxID=118510 RepID=A0A6L2KT73_TANCI|nr:hypothetical protein [Tanacetum cinerariifolium]
MLDFPNDDSFWNLLNSGNMNFGSTSNSQFPGFSSQARILNSPGKKKSNTSVSTGGLARQANLRYYDKQLRLKREAAFELAKDKDRTVMRLEEMKFLAISTKDLSEDDAYFNEEQKKTIRAKYNLYRNVVRA